MIRPSLPFAVLTVLALVCHVRFRFVEDWPELAEAILLAGSRHAVARRWKPCRCLPCGCRV